MKAMDRYKRENRRPFPTWSEVLEILRSLGYRRVAEPTALPGASESNAAVTKIPEGVTADAIVKMLFEKLERQYPQLAQAWNALMEWFAKYGKRGFIEEKRFVRQIEGVDALTLATALEVMVREKYLTRTYRLQISNGEFVGTEYESWQAIPDELTESLDDASEVHLVTAYRWGNVNALT
ncbi:Uncharacterized protein OS=Planctomyces maris DSM 8797 GN=PM8797T_17994 PE=4 SV=1 [Gemmata massiliana]|uniref:Uncharacterized protein n=2 Tax=Gemmata massiliana TaxID=1210884 RepID=A0A6P2CWP1_9BACT|nr:Uncharacterized protein OS=Planctomyces maris DSM 8797 GN=PM8797T_17994 PE=4 SV=1 [Gemmata massiliana]